jgi:hypothetical protein
MQGILKVSHMMWTSCRVQYHFISYYVTILSLLVSNIFETPLVDQKLKLATEGLEPYFLEHLRTKVSRENSMIIVRGHQNYEKFTIHLLLDII